MINRKVFGILYFSTIGLVSAVLIYKLTQSASQEIMTDVGSILPDFTLYDMERTSFKISSSDEPTVIVFFDSSCENCVYEAQIIKKNISLFGDASIVMLSTEAIPSIKQFSEQTGLLGYHNIKFGKMDPEEQARKFGQISFPYILVYGPDNRLLRKFQGTVDPKEILHDLHAR